MCIAQGTVVPQPWYQMMRACVVAW